MLFALKSLFLNITDTTLLQIGKSGFLGIFGVLMYFALLAVMGEREILSFFFSKIRREEKK